MKVAISTDGEYVSPHFGRCSHYTIYSVENGNVVEKEIIENPGHQPGFLPRFLSEKGIECIIAGGMGPKAASLFNEYRIKVITGVTGKVEDIINEFLNGNLKSGEDLCEHH